VTGDAHDAYAADDAILLYLVRDGDTEAYQVLRQRHEQAALRLAGCLGPPEEADDLVAEAFRRVLDVTLRGGGPIDAFRPYLLTTIRRAQNDRLRAERAGAPANAGELPDPGEPLIHPALAGIETSPTVRAFRSLPERWIAVLWHTEIEQPSPAETGQILGLAPGEVATLQRRAWDGLRQAYLQVHIADGARPDCQPVVRLLAAFVDNRTSSWDSTMVAEHLGHCDDCRAARAELSDIDAALGTMVAPVFLGTAASDYLSAEHGPAVGAATASAAATQPATATGPQEQQAQPTGPTGPAAGSPDAVRAALALPAGQQPAAGQPRRTARAFLWAIAAAIPAIGVAVALTLTFATGRTPQQSQHQPQAQAAVAPTSAGTAGEPHAGKQPKKATASADPAGDHSGSSPASVSSRPASAGGAAGAGPSAEPSPGQSAPAAAQLSAAVNADVWQTNQSDIVWTVTDTGNAATGDLTVSLTFPAGSSLQSGGADQAESEGWTCQATNDGASCQTGPVAAGSQAQGAVVITLEGPYACGYPVDMAASSGKASASTVSPEGIPCNPRE
jgi:DNA-directed RNA polymerase specialized sigma24 family protein